MADLQLPSGAMDKKYASERLMQLATGDSHRSKTARLRDLYEEVEAAIQAGVHQKAILAELKVLGLEMSPATFKSALQRIRAEIDTTPVRVTTTTAPSSRLATDSLPPPALPATPSSPDLIPKFKFDAHDPRRLDEALRYRPDMKALAKLAKKGKPP